VRTTDEYWRHVQRHLGLWSREVQARLADVSVAVGGVGGIGASAGLLLAKAGIGRIVVVDRDTYGIENIVEQAFAMNDTTGAEKAAAAAIEMRRHAAPGSRVTGLTADLADLDAARRLVSDVDLVLSGVDNPEARISLGRAAAERGIPMVVPANIGWAVVSTVYLPGEYNYAAGWRGVPGVMWEGGFPDMTHAESRAAVQREWDIWVAAVSGFEPDALRQWLERRQSYYWYAAPQAFFASSVGVLDAIAVLAGLPCAHVFPEAFLFDMKNAKLLSREELAQRRDRLRERWADGPDAIIGVIERLRATA
jgi:molybdopterin/thiamine biosynthesis adenylyltransferase